MNKSFALNKKAQHLAAELLKQVVENEPNITADLQNIAREISAEMVGLESKFKTEMSLIQKLIESVGDDWQRLQRNSKNINDVLRYTFVLSVDDYVKCFRQTIEKLRELGYKIPENRIWNAWENIGTQYDKGYRGINITVISSQRQNFELQFHTEASFEMKTETHELYKEARQPETLPKRREEIKKIVLKKAEKVEIPKGVMQWNM